MPEMGPRDLIVRDRHSERIFREEFHVSIGKPN